MNDSMGQYVASEVVKLMINKDIRIKDSNILILGITFKENCPDVRNTKVIDVISSLKEYGTNITIYDPWADQEEVFSQYNLKSTKSLPNTKFDSVVLTVGHKEYLELDFNLLRKKNSILYDVKNILPKRIKEHGL